MESRDAVTFAVILFIQYNKFSLCFLQIYLKLFARNFLFISTNSRYIFHNDVNGTFNPRNHLAHRQLFIFFCAL